MFNNSEIIQNLTESQLKNLIANPPATLDGYPIRVNNGKLFIEGDGRFVEVVPIEQRADLVEEYFKSPVTTGGYHKLYNIIKQEYAGISKRFILNEIKKYSSYQQRQRVRTRKIVKPTITTAPLQHWQMDLIDLKKYSAQNDGYNYIMVVIDLQKKSKVWIVIYSLQFISNFILEGNYERTSKRLMLIINRISFLFQDSLNSIGHTTY
jgi:hypothetical protein